MYSHSKEIWTSANAPLLYIYDILLNPLLHGTLIWVDKKLCISDPGTKQSTKTKMDNRLLYNASL